MGNPQLDGIDDHISTDPVLNPADGKFSVVAWVKDGAPVAEATQDGLKGSDNGLYIGSGKGMEFGTYWSGLIYDVRIYDRAVRP